MYLYACFRIEMANLRATIVALIASLIAVQQCFVHASFSDSCYFYWGADRGRITGWNSLELMLEEYGGSGMKSKYSYMYGAITSWIKLMPGNSAGTVTTFYLSSTGDKHDEIDFEFLGNSTGEPYTIHTNIFTKGYGQREQQFRPWFNPADGYHKYTIFWSPYSVVWLIDNIPIRVFRNYHDSEINFPASQPMNAYASLWNADDWATQGGRVKTDWSLAPFIAQFQNYDASACYCSNSYCVAGCSRQTPSNWWANPSFYRLSDAQLGQMNWFRDNFMIYDYCKDYHRFNGQLPKECNLPQY